MMPLVRVIAVAFGAWLVASLFVDRQTSIEVMAGMLGPLAAVVASWVWVDRIFRRNPGALTSFMIVAFAGKLVFFGAYVALALRVLQFRLVPFVASFTSYFIGLYLIEALYMRRLFWGGMRAPR